MKIKTILAAAVFAGLCSTAAPAAEPQEIRQEQMKAVGDAFGALNAISRGQRDYDADVVRASLEALVEAGNTFPDNFPEGSETGFDTEASISIWENPEAFRAASLKLASDAEAALASFPADQAGVGAAVGTVGANCSSCHREFRVRR